MNENHQDMHQITPFLDSNNELKKIDNKEAELTNQKQLLEETKLLATFLFQKPKNTRLAYESDIKKFFSFYRGKTLKEITATHVVVYFKNFPQIKESTKARLRASLSSLYKYLIKVGYIDKNPIDGVDSISVADQTHEKVLSLDEVREMIKREENKRNKLLIEFLVKTGLRISEALNVKPIHIREHDEKVYLSVVGKGNKTRTILLQNELFNKVCDLHGRSDKNLCLFRAKNSDQGINISTAWNIINKAGKRIGIDNVSPHWLRHTHATLSLKLGDDLRVIQQTLGHNSIVTTTKYVKVFPEQSSGLNLKF